MRARFRSWWKKVKQHPWIAVAVVAGIALTVLGYWLDWDWTGLGSYTPPTQAGNFQQGKTLWDWLQLLFIPIMLAIGGFWLNQVQKSREEKVTEERTKIEQEAAEKRTEVERETAEKRAQAEREVAEDNQREAALQAYIDKISELLLEKNLRMSTSEDEVRNIARVRTLTILPRLNGKRKGSVLQFLYESGLIDKANCIVDLHGADLREAFLAMINLYEAHLVGVDLGKANLIGANLIGADLRGAMIDSANLIKADLTMANLSGVLLGGSDMSGVNLSGANLSGASLIEVDLSEANLNKTNLRGVFLSGSNLSGAVLNGANLRGVVLRGGQLPDALVRDADLSGTDLQDTDLRQVIITTEQLKQTKSLKGVTMPDGSKHS